MRCPICGKTFDPDESSPLPFCDQRCRMVDLHGWLDERYGLPFESEREPGSEEPESPSGDC